MTILVFDPVLQHDLQRLKQHLLQTYGIAVIAVKKHVAGDVEIASWRNQQLLIKGRANQPIFEFFLISHVFGHLVQYAFHPYDALLQVIESQQAPMQFPSGFREAYFAYEKEAFDLGAGLMQQAGIDYARYARDYQAFMHADFELYWQYLTQARKSTDAELVALFEAYRQEPRTGAADAGVLIAPLAPPAQRFALTQQRIDVA